MHRIAATVGLVILAGVLIATTGAGASEQPQQWGPLQKRIVQLERDVAGLSENLAYAELDAYRRDLRLRLCVRRLANGQVWKARICLERVIR